GDVYIDDLVVNAGTVPGVSSNILQNSDFESPLSGPWTLVGFGHSNSALSTLFAHSGTNSLHVVATNAGSQNNCLHQAITPPPFTTNFTISYWFLASTNGTNLSTRGFSGGTLNFVNNYRSAVTPTPGASNSVVLSLPPYPLLWLNEALPLNATGLQD